MTEIASRADVEGLFRLDGRVAVITGGTRGIGRAMAVAFAAAGAKVVVASRKADACAEVEAALRADGHEALGVPVNAGNLEDLSALVSTTVERFGGIDIVVNNAANALRQDVGAFTDSAFTKSVDVNIKGPVFLTQEALPHLRASEHASVINIVSAGAFMFAGEVAMYAAAKAAMVSYTRSLASALVRDGIRVNAIAPGTVDTDMFRSSGPEAAAAMSSSSLMRRVAAPSEIVGPALLLASDAGSFMTGSVLHVDGGLVSG